MNKSKLKLLGPFFLVILVLFLAILVFFYLQSLQTVEAVLNQQIADFNKKCPIVLKKGEAVFHHPLMMHGSYENRSDRSRRATVINTLTDGVLSNFEGEDSPGTTNFPMLPKGQKMEGDFYPILFDPEHSLNGRTHLLRTINDI